MRCAFILLTLLLACSVAHAAEFVSPIGFKPTEENKRAVVEYIKQNVKEEHARAGMDSESLLRMMEEQNLEAFKKLLSAQDTKLLNRVIKQYCGIGMCSYVMIEMMYTQELEAKGKSLKW